MILTKKGTCDKLIVEIEDNIYTQPTDKGKPFERVGHKALEPKSAENADTAVSCQKGKLD